MYNPSFSMVVSASIETFTPSTGVQIPLRTPNLGITKSGKVQENLAALVDGENPALSAGFSPSMKPPVVCCKSATTARGGGMGCPLEGGFHTGWC